MTKRARRFRKMLMSEGIGRNAANYLVKRKSVTDALIMANITSSPGFVSVTGVWSPLRSRRDWHPQGYRFPGQETGRVTTVGDGLGAVPLEAHN